MYMNLGSQVTIINISLWKLLWVINASCEQRRLELSQMSCNRAARYASPHNRHQLTGPSYIRSSSLTKSLPSFLLSLLSHAVGYVPARVHFSKGRYCPTHFLFYQWGLPSVVFRGSRVKEWGFPHVPVWHLYCTGRKHSFRAVQTGF